MRIALTGRGFGVHSPFAFRFIREVLRLPLPYVHYSRLGTDEQRLAYRLAAFLQPAGIEALEGADAAVALMACPQPPVGAPPRWSLLQSRPLALAVGATPRQAIVEAAARGNVLCTGLKKKEIKAICGAIGRGMTFASTSGILVIISDPRLPRQNYDLFYK